MQASVVSTTGNILFDSDSDTIPEATLNSTGLSIGPDMPSAKLDVSGNAVITSSLSVGGSGMSSNLNIHGTFGQSFVTYSEGSNIISEHSVVFADTSNGNVKLFLPSANNQDGQLITIKKTSGSNELTIHNSDGAIEGMDVPMVSSNGNLVSLSLISSGNTWYVLDSSETLNSDMFSSNLMAHYRLDENSGVTVYDATGVSHGNMMGGMTFSSNSIFAQVGRGVNFGGGSGYIEVDHNAALNPNGDLLTICAWIRPNSIGDLMGVLKRTNGYEVRITAAGTIWGQVNEDTTSRATSPSSLVAGTWYWVTFTYDGAKAKIYLDGSQKAVQWKALSLNSPTQVLNIGHTGSGFDIFDGIIDDIRIYNRYLTSDEIEALYEWISF